MSTAAGWYPNGDQWETYWDGEQWADQHRPVGKPAGAGAPVQSHVQVDSESPLLKVTSHIEGKNALVARMTALEGGRASISWPTTLLSDAQAPRAVQAALSADPLNGRYILVLMELVGS